MQRLKYLKPLKRGLCRAGLLLLAGAAGPALACTLMPPGRWALRAYDPSAITAVAQPLTVRVLGDKGCQASLQVQWQGVAGDLFLSGPGSESLRLLLTTDAAGTQPLPAAPQDAGSVSLDKGRDTTLYLWARPHTAQWLAPGIYEGSLRLRLVGADGTLDERELTVSTPVLAAVRAAFAGSNGKMARLDFGELSQGAQRSAQLDVQANTGHRITLDSTRSGRLVNRQFAQSAIPYSLRVDGVVLQPGAANMQISSPSAGLARHRIEVEIGPIERVLAGEYTDDLLITLTAQ